MCCEFNLNEKYRLENVGQIDDVLWKDQDRFDNFMNNIHHPIVEKNNQGTTYYEYEVV